VPRISPFRGLLYATPRIGPLESLTSPPYDVITDEQQQRYRASSAYNVVHLEFNDKWTDDEQRVVQYRQAASLLSEWRQEDALVLDAEPAYYPYELSFRCQGGPRRIRGLICSVEIEDWGGSIIPHERTMERQVGDRLGLIRETRANLSPVYAVFPGPCGELSELLDGLTEPDRAMIDPDGVAHSLWRLRDKRISELLADQVLLIADGHHRYTVALKYRNEMRERFGPGPWDGIMMLVVDAGTEDLPVLPIHRVLRGGTLTDLGEPAVDLDAVLASLSDEPPSYGTVTLANGTTAYKLVRLGGPPPAVCALHEQLLDALAADAALTFTADPAEADRAVRAGEAVAAFFLPPTTAQKIRSVVDRGERMPQKSTYFWPKPRTGMVIRLLD